jgi:phosphinothricin acetyltransferase
MTDSMPFEYEIRLIEPGDAQPTLEIYRPYVEHTAISFEYEVPSLDDWKERMASYSAVYPWLVAVKDGRIAGYAYGSRHRSRTAYTWSPESTIYVAGGHHGSGVARTLYHTLFELLRLQGYVNVYAGVTVPNARSERFHLACGFTGIGYFRKVGFKFGEWHDTRWFQKQLVEPPVPPVRPLSVAELRNSTGYREIMAGASGG